jgi:hypothetical protein
MTEAGETDGFSAWEHVEAIYRHLGRYPDWVVVNTGEVSAERLTRYRAEGAEVVAFDPDPLPGGYRGRHAEPAEQRRAGRTRLAAARPLALRLQQTAQGRECLTRSCWRPFLSVTDPSGDAFGGGVWLRLPPHCSGSGTRLTFAAWKSWAETR